MATSPAKNSPGLIIQSDVSPVRTDNRFYELDSPVSVSSGFRMPGTNISRIQEGAEKDCMRFGAKSAKALSLLSADRMRHHRAFVQTAATCQWESLVNRRRVSFQRSPAQFVRSAIKKQTACRRQYVASAHAPGCFPVAARVAVSSLPTAPTTTATVERVNGL